MPKTDLDQAELLPCPFCGKQAEMFTRGPYVLARCKDECCPGMSVFASPQEWNRRAHMQDQEAQNAQD